MLDVATLSLSHFKPLVGEVFAVDDPGYSEDLTLADAVEMPDRSGHARAAGCFTLMFHGSSTTHVMGQGIHRLSHPALGDMEIAIAPRGTLPAGTIRYSAIFY